MSLRQPGQSIALEDLEISVAPFEVGDVVQLCSGGAPMTVGHVDLVDDHWVIWTVWLDTSGAPHHGDFHVAMLEYAE